MTKILLSEGWKRTTRRWLWGMQVDAEDFPGGPGLMLIDPEGRLTYVTECPDVPQDLAVFCRQRGVRAAVHVTAGAQVRVEYREPLRQAESACVSGQKRKSGPVAQ